MLVIDGNFKVDHVRMRNRKDDVELTNGDVYMVEDTRYKEHIAVARDVKQVCYLALMLCFLWCFG